MTGTAVGFAIVEVVMRPSHLVSAASLLAAVAAAGTSAVVAHGSPTTSPTTSPGGSTPSSTPAVDPALLDTQVIRVSLSPTHNVMPSIVVGASGTVYFLEQAAGQTRAAQAPDVRQPPPPAPQPMMTRRLTPRGLEMVLRRADELGLFTAREYQQAMVTDQATTYVELTRGRSTLVHEVYALGFDGTESDPDRNAVLTFVRELSDLDALVGSEVGPATRYLSTTFLVRDAYGDVPSSPTPWPQIAVQHGCVRLPLAAFQLPVEGTYATDEGTTLAVLPALPGGPCAEAITAESVSSPHDSAPSTQP